jgi:tetratricopeptide (TPR) repeat protein
MKEKKNKKSRPGRLILKVDGKENSRAGLNTLISLAEESFRTGRYTLAIEYCSQITELAEIFKIDEIACQGYYIMCLAALKLRLYDDAEKCCNQAREKLGDYLDLAYFRLLISAVKSDTVKIPDLALEFIEIFDKSAVNPDPFRIKTCHKIGEVLLMWGQALEELGDPEEAVTIYEKYIELYPEDKNISAHLSQLMPSVKK